jgi:hypothetical protein
MASEHPIHEQLRLQLAQLGERPGQRHTKNRIGQFLEKFAQVSVLERAKMAMLETLSKGLARIAELPDWHERVSFRAGERPTLSIAGMHPNQVIAMCTFDSRYLRHVYVDPQGFGQEQEIRQPPGLAATEWLAVKLPGSDQWRNIGIHTLDAEGNRIVPKNTVEDFFEKKTSS